MIKATIAIIDLAIIFVLSFFIYKGYKNGFVKEFMRFLGAVAGLIVAIRYMSNLTLAIFGVLDISPTIITIFSFIVLFTSVVYLFKYLSTKFLQVIKFSMTLGSLDRVAGIALGLAKGAIFVSLITVLLSFATFSGPLNNEIKQSQLFNPMRQVLPLAYSTAKLVYSSKYKSFYKELEENFSGQTSQRKGPGTQRVLDFYRPN